MLLVIIWSVHLLSSIFKVWCAGEPERWNSQYLFSHTTQAFVVGAGQNLIRCYGLFIWLLLFHQKESTATRLPQICQRSHYVVVTVLRKGPDPQTPCSVQVQCFLYPPRISSSKYFFFININQWRLWPNCVGCEQQSCTGPVNKCEVARSQYGLLILAEREPELF